MCADGFGHLRVAVAGQIHHKVAVGQLKKIDVLRAPRGFGYIRQAHMAA